jgi:hypothetical protein
MIKRLNRVNERFPYVQLSKAFKGETSVLLNKKIAKKVFLPPVGGIEIKALRAREITIRAFNEMGLFFSKKTPVVARNMDVDAQIPLIKDKFIEILPELGKSTNDLRSLMGSTDHDPFTFFGRAMNVLQAELVKLPNNTIIKISSGLKPLEVANEKEVLGYMNKGYAKNLHNTSFDLGVMGFFSILCVLSHAYFSGWYMALLAGADYFAGLVSRDIVHHFIDRSYYKTIEFGKSGPEKTA